jgi:tripartite-type tricarboxylate transporter receptor subunit TctC
MALSRYALYTAAVLALFLAARAAAAQDYPNKPVRIVAGAAGGGGDFTARLVAQGIAGALGQPVIVDNRGAPIIGAEYVSRAPADGYTLFVSGDSIWILPLLQKVSYDVLNDFAPVSLLVREVNVLVVHPSLPVHNVRDLIALAKAKPGALNYATSAIGTAQHIGTELFKIMAGVDIVNVPYRGTAPALSALLAGEAHVAFTDPSLAMPHVKTGKLRALAVTSAEPSALVPGLPTVAASGLPGFEAIGVTVMLAPAKTPQLIVRRLNQEIVRALRQPDIKEKFFNSGVEVVASTPEDLAATIKAEMVSFEKVIKDAGIKLN